MMKKSFEIKEEIRKDISKLLDTVDSLYHTLYRELQKETSEARAETVKIEKEIKELYDKLTEVESLKLIKSKLPLRVRLFNKIVYLGHGVTSSSQKIEVCFSFNEPSYAKSLKYTFSSEEVKNILNS